ncbi:MAG: tripartite tricarboxylate transporter substrate-binding protein [Burkholderiaceae bacterium]
MKLILNRRRTLALLAAAPALAVPGVRIRAQELKGPIRIIVGYPPGGTVDQIARLYGDELRQSLGVAVVVENRTGAGGQLAADMLRSQPADGSTLLVANNHMMSTLPLTTPAIKYDPVADFEPVSMLAIFEVVLAVSSALGATRFAEYVELVRRQPQRGAYGIPAPGSLPQFIGYSIGQKEKLAMSSVPYRGAAPLVVDLLGGQIPAGILTYANDLLEHHRNGRLRILATSGARRLTALPSVPTFTELGYPGVSRSIWMGLFAPKGTPRAAVERLNKLVIDAAARPALAEAANRLGLTAATSSADALRQSIREEIAVWAPVVKASGYTAD